MNCSGIFSDGLVVLSAAIHQYQGSKYRRPSFVLTLPAIWSIEYKAVLGVASDVGGTCPVARYSLHLVRSFFDFRFVTSCINRSTVGALSLCALGVDRSTGAALFNCRDGVARSIEITFGIQSSSIVMVGDVVSIIRRGPKDFGNSFDRSSMVIRWDVVLAVGSPSTLLHTPGRNIVKFCTDLSKCFLCRACAALNFLYVFVHISNSRCKICRRRGFACNCWDESWGKAGEGPAGLEQASQRQR